MEGRLFLLSLCLSFIVVDDAAGAFNGFGEAPRHTVSVGYEATEDSPVAVREGASCDMASVERCASGVGYGMADGLVDSMTKDAMSPVSLKRLYEYKAEVCYWLGDYRSAYDNLLEAYRIVAADSPSAAGGIGRVADDMGGTEAVIADSRMRMSRRHSMIWIISAVSLSLVAGMSLALFHYRRIAKVRFSIFRRMEDTMTHNKKMRDYTLNRIRRDMNGDDTLFLRIDDAVRDNGLFRSHSVSRRDVAVIVGSNETYVSNSVKEATGLTFSEYVNAIRLDYACNLMKSDGSLTVDVVSDESGFSSSRTFYRLFKERFGLTPSQYAKAAHTV